MSATELPDLILVMTDQQRADQIGYGSDGRVRTPNLDSLAADGVIFEHSYSASTTCVPARTSLMTGLLDHRVPYSSPLAMDQGFWTVPHALRAAGYQTALIGKMHFKPMRADHGFDHVRVCEHLNAYSQDPRTIGQLDHYHDWLHDRGLLDWRFETDDAMGSSYRYDIGTHPTSWVRDETLAFLEQRDRTRPLFLVVSFPHPHPPINPPEPYASLYESADCQIDPDAVSVNQYLPNSFRVAMAQTDAPHRRIDPSNLAPYQRSLARTYGLVTQVDDAVGAITAQLDLSNALLWFTSDHGDFGGHRGLVRKIPWIPFDDLAKVPCFAAGGLVAGGRTESAPMQSFDFSVTCMSLAGVPIDLDLFDGMDLAQMLRDPSASLESDREVFSALSVGYPMVRRGPHKLIRDLGWNAEVLFDVERDPVEMWNVASLDLDGAIVGELGAALDRQASAQVPALDRFDSA